MGLTRTRFSQANTAVARIQDPITVLNNESTVANVDVGFLINRNHGIKSNVTWFWSEGNNEFRSGLSSNTGVADANIIVSSYANLRIGTLYGNIGGASDIANVYVSGSIIPTANVAYDLGNDNLRFRDLWLSGTTLHIGNQRLTVTNNQWQLTTPTSTVVLGVDSTIGNLTVTGNLNLQGSSSTFDSNNLAVQDSIIELHTKANLAPLTGDDGRDIGIKIHYYKTQDEHAFLGWANDTGYLEWYDSGREGVGNVFTGNTYGTIKSGGLILTNTTPSTSTTTGVLRVAGGVGIAGNLYIANVGDVSANIGTVKNNLATLDANVASYQMYANANAASQQTSITTLTSNAAAQQVSIDNIDANIGSYQLYANANIGSITIQLGSITSGANANTAAYLLTATGNISAGNLIASGNIYGGLVPTAIFKDIYLGTSAVSLARGSGSLTVDNFNTTGYAAQANLAELATNATKTTVSSNITSGTAYVTFVSSTTGNVAQNLNTSLTYNPNSGNLRAYGIQTDTGVYWAGNGAAFSSSPGGTTGQLQYNDAGSFTGANLIFNNTNGNLVITSTTTSTSTTTGALIARGGAGVAGNIVASGNLTVGRSTVTQFAGAVINVANQGTDGLYVYQNNTQYITLRPNQGSGSNNPLTQAGDLGIVYSNGVVDGGSLTVVQWSNTARGYRIDNTGVFEHASGGNVVVASTTAATSSTTGSFVTRGGVGITGALYNGGVHVSTGNIVVASGTATTSVTTGALVLTGSGGLGVGGAATLAGNVTIGTTTLSARANLFLQGGNLAATPGSTLKMAEIYSTVTNASYIQFLTQRHAQGSDWTTANTRIQQMIDVTPQGYIEFNPIGANYGVAIGSTNFQDIMKFHDSTGNVVIRSSTASTTATTGALVVGGGVGISGNIFTAGWMIPTANTTQNLGTTTNWWGTFYGVSTQARYADLAENYKADDNYQPGTVLIFGGDKEVTTTTLSHDTRVAGIVSTNPGYLMNAASEGLPVAFTGRVPCLVRGPVDKGTVLVTSNLAGTAEAINTSMFRPGCILGKSLEQITDNSVKLVEVVVGRF